MQLIGYSSDELEVGRVFNNVPAKMSFGKLIKTKAQRLQEKRDKLFTKAEPIDSNEWFVYLVDGEKWYFKVAQDLRLLKMHHRAEFLGTGMPNQVFAKEKEILQKISESKDYGKCCYCEVGLTIRIGLEVSPTDKTKDHIHPKSKGGKMKLLCCFKCNQEKADLSLREYIICLNILFANTNINSSDYKTIQTKIKNANEIAKTLKST